MVKQTARSLPDIEGPKRPHNERLVCSKETKRIIIEDCIALFKKHNPDVEDMDISQDYILKRIAKYYLEN